MNRSQAAGLALVVVGLAVVAGGFVHFGPGQPAYHHEVQNISAEQAEQIANQSSRSVTDYSELSANAKSAFDDARRRGGEATMRGAGNRPPEWSYTPDNSDFALVHHQGRYYVVATEGGDVPTLATIGFGLSVLIGLAVAGAGTWRYRNPVATVGGTPSTAVAIAGVVALLVLVGGSPVGFAILPLTIVVLTLVLVVGAGAVLASGN